MKAERKCSTDIIAQILQIAKGGQTISFLAEKVGNVSTVNRYMPTLLKCNLLRIGKAEKHFLSEDGREYGILYFTTKKGMILLRKYADLLALLSEDKKGKVKGHLFGKDVP